MRQSHTLLALCMVRPHLSLAYQCASLLDVLRQVHLRSFRVSCAQPPSLPFFIIGFGVGLYVVIVHSCTICICLGWLVFCSNSYVLFNCQEIEESNEAMEDCSRLIEELHCWAWERPQFFKSEVLGFSFLKQWGHNYARNLITCS